MKKFMFIFLEKIRNLLKGSGLSKIPGINFLYKKLYQYFNPEEIILIDVNNLKFFINSADEGIFPHLYRERNYEEFETKLFKDLIKPGMVVIDIGANFGYYSIIAGSLLKQNGLVYSIEPEPSNFELLKKNIKVNNLTNIIPIQKAISNKKGVIKLFLDKLNLGKHSLSENNVEINNSINVETITLDELLDSTIYEQKIDLIKMDVQGSEGLVFEGALKTLTSDKLVIMMEFWPEGLRNMGYDPLSLLNKIGNLGFEIGFIDDKNHQIKKYTNIEIVNKLNNIENGNILLKKQE